MATASVPNADFVSGNTISSSQTDANNQALVDFLNNSVVHLDGSKTMTGALVLPSSSPTTDNQATRKKYVDDHIRILYPAAFSIAAGTSTSYTNMAEYLNQYTPDYDYTLGIMVTGALFTNTAALDCNLTLDAKNGAGTYTSCITSWNVNDGDNVKQVSSPDDGHWYDFSITGKVDQSAGTAISTRSRYKLISAGTIYLRGTFILTITAR